MSEYNRSKAVEYAKKWALKRNDAYYNFDPIGGDCTNFASQCVFAGAETMNYERTYGWYYINGNDKSPSWTGVEYFYNFMTSNKSVGPYGEKVNLSEINEGDLIQIAYGENFVHTLVVTLIEQKRFKKEYYICAHTFDAYMRPLSSYNYSKLRCIHILGVKKTHGI